MKHRIEQVVKNHAGLELHEIEHSTNLYRAGMTSYASVTLMIALENEFGVEFPDHMLSRSVFESVDSIAAAIESLTQVSR